MTALTIAAMGMATAPSAFASASASDRTPAISVGLNAFAAKVETLGEARFPGTFAGATLTSAGVVKVYATSTRDAALTSAIAKLNSGHYRVTYTAAKFSYRKLDALNAALVSHQSRLQKDGVELAISSPDAAAGTVQVTLLRPTRAVLARLSSSGVASPNLGPLTTANYATAASAIISTAVGAGYTVQHALQARPRRPSRRVPSRGVPLCRISGATPGWRRSQEATTSPATAWSRTARAASPWWGTRRAIPSC